MRCWADECKYVVSSILSAKLKKFKLINNTKPGFM